MPDTHTGGVRRNTRCHCGCGFPTGQRNGYVRGHTPPRQEREPRPLSLRLQAVVTKALPLARRSDISFTPVRASETYTESVHIGVDEGSYDSKPMCGALANRATETTDTPANCSSCATIIKAIGLEYLIKDEDGYTDLYQPRKRY
jgi:hypothetical protein